MHTINDDNAHLYIGDGFGLIPRNYDTFPIGFYANVVDAVDMPLIPRSEWSERIKQGERDKSFLSHIRNRGNNGSPIPSLNQGSFGYCWAHSGTSAVMLLRAAANQPYVPLSAFSVAATIKKGRNEGGWGAQGLDFMTEKGIASQALWPQGDASYARYDVPEVWADAAKHRVTEGFWDLQAAQYDRRLTFDQVGTLLLSRIPVIGDFNWWGHSVCLMDLVETSPGQFGVRILNSWGDGWGDNGTSVLTGSKAIPDGATAPRVAVAA